VQHTLRLLLAGVIVGVVLSAAQRPGHHCRARHPAGHAGFMLGSTGFVGWTAAP
jgi:iron complex transport system permease protein